MKTYWAKRAIYVIGVNADGTLTVRRAYSRKNKTGVWKQEKSLEPIQNAGMWINQEGGIEAILSKCKEVDDLASVVVAENQTALAERAERKAEHAKAEAAQEERYNTLFAGEVTETTAETVYVLLQHLNRQNWGAWNLPKMTIGYACHQYDCNGTTATTIKLDKPIMVAGELGSAFEYGAPHNHLTHYRKIVDWAE